MGRIGFPSCAAASFAPPAQPRAVITTTMPPVPEGQYATPRHDTRATRQPGPRKFAVSLTASLLLHGLVIAALFCFTPNLQRWRYEAAPPTAPAPVVQVRMLTLDQTLALTHRRRPPAPEQAPTDSTSPPHADPADATPATPPPDIDRALPPLNPTMPPPANSATPVQAPALTPPTAAQWAEDPPLPEAVVVAGVDAPALAQRPAPITSPHADRSASLVRMPTPTYPPEARQAGHEGLVVLELLIDEQGRVVSVRVVQSAADAALDQAAVTAARQARFEPAIRFGQPVSQRLRLPVRFRLEG